MIAIVDYGVGNLYSLSCSLRHIGAEGIVTRDETLLRAAEKIILPGVGAFGDAAEKLRELRLDTLLGALAAEGTPLLGICLGMQLLFAKSFEYGEHEGLGLIDGSVRALAPALSGDEKVPHMGWNSLCFANGKDPLLRGIAEGSFVYYVHSYYVTECADALTAFSHYGGVPVPGIVRRKNVCGTQFHPEKSGKVGLGILKNFVEEGRLC